MEKYGGILKLFGVKDPVGFTDKEIADAKAAVGELPSELEKFYRYCGNSPELHGLQDELVRLNKYPPFPDLDHIVFFNENQGVCRAAVRKSDAKLSDPPVYASADNGEWKLSSPRVSEFLCAMYDYQASICLEYNPEDFYLITPEEKAMIEKMFPKLGEFDNWLYGRNITVYGENGGRIALMDNGDVIQMNFAANNEDEFKRMSALPEGIGEPI